MQRIIIDLPDIFGPLLSDPVINVRGRSAGDAVQGSGQVVYGAQPRWEMTLQLWGGRRNQVMTWDAIRAKLRGRINVLRVPMRNAYRPTLRDLGLPDADALELSCGPGGAHDDGTLFDDCTGYDIDPVLPVAAEIVAGAETMTLDAAPVGDALQPGHWFSHDDWPYKVTGIWEEDGLTTYAFEPPLRRAIPAGAEILLNATALMALEGDLDGRMPLQLGKRGEATINLVEWTNRP